MMNRSRTEIRRTLLLRSFLVVLLALAVFTVTTYEFLIRPGVQKSVQVQMRNTTDLVESEISNLIASIEVVNRTSRIWISESDVSLDNEVSEAENGLNVSMDMLRRFNAFLVPLLQSRQEVSSVLVARETGSEILLMRQADGSFANRLTNPARWGTRAFWVRWNSGFSKPVVESIAADYDARVRPWFRGAQAAGEGVLFWTEPYLFFTTKDPGMTVSVRVRDDDGTAYIIANDLRLVDLSNYTRSLKAGENGIAALFDKHMQVLGVPRDSRYTNEESIRKTILKPLSEDSPAVLREADDAWKRAGMPENRLMSVALADGKNWFYQFQSMSLGTEKIWLAVYVPESDFAPIGPREVALWIGLILLSLGLAAVVMSASARKFARPLELLVRESERIGRMDLSEPVRVPSRLVEVVHLVDAQEMMRQNLLGAMRRLEESNLTLESRVADRTRELEVSTAAAEWSRRLIVDMTDWLPCAVFRYELSPEGVGSFKFVSSTVRDIWHCSHDELLENPDLRWRYVHPDDLEDVKRSMQRSLDEKTGRYNVCRVIWPDGSLHWIEAKAIISARTDGTYAWNGYWQDVTDRKVTEAEMALARSMAEEAARVKSEFLANMSHEIRTPMNAVIGLSHLLKKTSIDARQRDYVDKILRSGQHLLGVLNDILDFSKIESGKLRIEQSDFDLEVLLSNVAELISEKVEKKGLELVFDLPADVPRLLIGDSLRLGQILINYANNAVKFTDRGEISVRVRQLDISDTSVLLRFDVCDTGIGLSEAQQASLFQSFQQADTSISRKYGGTGLGLAICKQLAVLMDGEVGVQSTVGEGSTFWFTARLGVSREQPRALKPEPDLRELRVLSVDDNDAARAVMHAMLSSMTFLVEDGINGQQALLQIEAADSDGEPFRVVFLDWNMPDMNGPDVARTIRALPLSFQPHIVLMTASDREDARQSALGVGVAHVLSKPVSASSLFDTVVSLFGNEPKALVPPGFEPASGLERQLARIAGARILLVEDNEINQEVAAGLLRAAGFTVDIANNGHSALDWLEREPSGFDLVLMDMQMPGMDGPEATRQIRRREWFADLPVIAMTANALAQDRTVCLEAGMNDFLTKPIEPELLWEALLRWIPARGALIDKPERQRGDEDGNADIPNDIPGLNIADGLRRVSGNKVLYRRLLIKFVEGQRGMPSDLKQAITSGDLRKAERLVHTCKGVAGNVGAEKVQKLAAGLEAMLRAADLASNTPALEQLSSELESLCDRLEASFASEGTVRRQTEPKAENGLKICEQILQQLADSDPAATETWSDHSATLRQLFPRNFVEISNSIQSFEFDAAQALLRQAMIEVNLPN